MKKSELKQVIKEELKKSLTETQDMREYYDQIIDLIRTAARNLNDDDAYELHEKLKRFFNKLI
jgi:hypothetical protein